MADGMRIGLISDVHTEFFYDKIDEWVATLDPSQTDVLAIAGDLGNSHTVLSTLEKLARHYGDQPIVYVPGNHEYYHSGIFEMSNRMDEFFQDHPTLHLLPEEPGGFKVGDVTFVGVTLWFTEKKDRRWSDFVHIAGLSDAIHVLGDVDRAMLEDDCLKWGQKKTEGSKLVVVTHMMPSTFCIHPKWEGSTTNKFFLNDCEDLIFTHSPALWLYGHTHERMDVQLFETRMVSNPMGYPHERPEDEVYGPKVIEL